MPREEDYDVWSTARRLVEIEWDLLKGMTRAAGAAVKAGEAGPARDRDRS